MKGIRKVFKNIDIKEFKRYLFFSFLLIITLITLSFFNFTQARYESNTVIDLKPTLAFFIVDVESQSKQIKLEGMVPRNEPYLYTFNVSNFNEERRANVDLTYTIEIVTTTNMPLNFRLFRGSANSSNEVDSDTITSDDNGVYFRHLVINDTNVMNYSSDVTDVYTLWVEFPIEYQNNADDYAGIIELVDVRIRAEQVV